MDDNRMTASQFARLCGITKDTLTWYQRKGLIQPSLTGKTVIIIMPMSSILMWT